MGRWNNLFDCHYKKMGSDNLLCNGLRMTNDLFTCAQRLFVAESANYIHVYIHIGKQTDLDRTRTVKYIR